MDSPFNFYFSLYVHTYGIQIKVGNYDCCVSDLNSICTSPNKTQVVSNYGTHFYDTGN